MKGIVSIQRIMAARQRLAELSELSSGRPGREIQVCKAVDLLSSVLDELEAVAKDNQQEEEAGYGSESRFNVVAESATDGIISIDDQSTIRYVNPAAGQMFGYELAEMLGKNLTSLMPERFRQIHLDSVSRYLTTGQRHVGWRAIELTGLHKSGREFPIEVSFGADIRNGRHFFTGIVRDITDRKRAEEALRASEQRMEAIIDNTTALIFIKDLELRYLLVNREYERLFDVQRDQLRGMTDFDIHPHDVAETLRANDRQVIESGEPMQFEEVVPSHGSASHYVVAKFLLRDHVNEPYAICGIATDITALKRTEELQTRRARLAALFADIHAAFSSGTESALRTTLQRSAEAIARHLDAAFARIWTLNNQENTLELQASAGQYTRLDGEHARVPVGKLKIGLIAQERQPHLTNDVVNDKRISHPDWARREGMVAFAGYPLVVEGHLVGVLAMFARKVLESETLNELASVADTIAQGIERKQAAEALKRAEEELRQKEASLHEAQTELAHVSRLTTMGELAASIAHEVNQPLAAVVNNGSACLRWLAAQKLDEARQSATLVVADGHRAGEIIARVRALAKKTPPQKDWLDLNETIDEVIAMASSEVQRNHVSLQTELANDLPLILGDRIQLQQVILNLLINAIEAMSGASEGPRELCVTSEKVESTGVRVAVRDSGPGLDRKAFDHLFDAFYTTKPHGLGMGLAISRSIIEAHGGRLRAKANTPRGAVFQFALPVRDERTS